MTATALLIPTLILLALAGGLWLRARRRHNRIQQDAIAEQKSQARNEPETTTGNNDTEPQNAFDHGLKLYRTGHFAAAFPVLLHHAEQEHPLATTLVARMYYAGNGVDRNEERYRYWLQQAARLGDKSSKAKSKRLKG